MKLFSDWGFTRAGWKTGQRGEYWVVGQGILIAAFFVLPPFRLAGWSLPSEPVKFLFWSLVALLSLAAVFLMGKGFLDLGQQLTPLPYPKDDGQLVQSGVYGLVRHPLYSGLILGGLAISLGLWSASHLALTLMLGLFLNAKASREEKWLTEKYPNYRDYQQQVKKLIPYLF